MQRLCGGTSGRKKGGGWKPPPHVEGLSGRGSGDLDLSGLGLFAFIECDAEDAIVEGGIDFFLIDGWG